MALIPTITGVVTSVVELKEGYYRSQVSLDKAKRMYSWGQRTGSLPEPLTIMSCEPLDKLEQFVGLWVDVLAFPLGDDTWEAEGFARIHQPHEPQFPEVQ